jgi:hypothetical protein
MNISEFDMARDPGTRALLALLTARIAESIALPVGVPDCDAVRLHDRAVTTCLALGLASRAFQLGFPDERQRSRAWDHMPRGADAIGLHGEPASQAPGHSRLAVRR